MLAERVFENLGLKVIAHKDMDTGKAYRTVELLGLNNINSQVIKSLVSMYGRSLSKIYGEDLNDFTQTLNEGKIQVILIPDIQMGDSALMKRFEAVCTFLEKK